MEKIGEGLVAIDEDGRIAIRREDTDILYGWAHTVPDEGTFKAERMFITHQRLTAIAAFIKKMEERK